MKLPYRVLVLEDDENALAGIVELLSESGYDVTACVRVRIRQAACSQRRSYDLFMTDVRAAQLQRAASGQEGPRRTRRTPPSIIMTGYDEPLMQLEASRYSAQFIKKPIKSRELLDAVRRSLSSVRRERRWPRKRVLGGFRVTAAGRPAAVVDVSYGGLCLEIPAADSVPALFDVEVSGINLHLMVEPVWSSARLPARSSAAPRSPPTPLPPPARGGKSSIAFRHKPAAPASLR